MTPHMLFSKTLIRTAVICATIGLSASAASAQSRPFEGMAGVWSGSGTIELEDGSKERIRCKASYAVSSEGTGLNQSLRCASDSYKFELKSDVIAAGGALSGQWTETSRGVAGSLEGRASKGHFSVVVSSPAFTAKLDMTTNGNKQNVVVTSESQLKAARISLTKS